MSDKQVNADWKIRVVTFLVYHASRVLASTLRLQVSGENQIDVIRRESGTGVILVTWHGRTFVPITRFKDRGFWAIISTSRDGNYQNSLFGRFGFNTVRGSTSARGAVACALAMARELKKGAVLAHTPDGPRGPAHKVHPGAIFLAQKSGCPILPAGISAYGRWSLNTWDHYQIPYPFARAAMIFGEPIHVPPRITEEERDSYSSIVCEAINRLEGLADDQVKARRSQRPRLANSETGAAGGAHGTGSA